MSAVVVPGPGYRRSVLFFEAACSGKERFETRRMAERVARDIRRRRDGPMHAYQCAYCGAFHVAGVPS